MQPYSTFSGKPAVSSSSIFQETVVCQRYFQELGPETRNLRDLLNSQETFNTVGKAYSSRYSKRFLFPSNHPNAYLIKKKEGQFFKIANSVHCPCGGYFRQISLVKDPSSRGYACDYILEHCRSNFEDSGIDVDEEKKKIGAYGVIYFLDLYCEPLIVDPEEGDLVYYPNSTSDYIGFYRQTGAHRSLKAESIQGKVFGDDSLYEHDVFFVPSSFGDKVEFYRIKKDLNAKRCELENPIPYAEDVLLAQQDSEDTFLFHCPEGAAAVREAIDRLNPFDVAAHLEVVPSLRCIRTKKAGGSYCYTYAFDRIWGVGCRPKGFPEKPQDHDIQLYFDPVNNPQAGDLVCYYNKGPEEYVSSIAHYGVVLGPGWVISKWGKSYIFIHPTFGVASRYGPTVKFYRLKSLMRGKP